MRIFKVIYEVVNKREVWVETNNPFIDRNEVEQLFWDNFSKYNDESDDADDYGGITNVLTIDEIDKDGNDIE